ncbi:MAG: hypothetical protein LUD81_00340 [Clostridiales bacterium]|nr:hypothetical protein [Clostridiales bacterium]
MNILIAKLKNNNYRKILSTDSDIYGKISDMIEESTAYSPANSVLEDKEWYVIESFSAEEYASNIIKKPMNTVDFEMMTKEEHQKIDFIFTMDNEKYCFQKVGKAKLARKKRILYRGESYEYYDKSEEIVINDISDAIYIKETDSLYFRKLSSITGIFNGIDRLYREATEEETKSFLKEGFISLTDGFSADKVKTQNRKRIAAAKDVLSKLSEDDKSQMFSYIGDYCPDLKTVNNSFKVGKEEQLKMLLYGIEQRFYTTPVGGQKRIANSVKTLTVPEGDK